MYMNNQFWGRSIFTLTDHLAYTAIYLGVERADHTPRLMHIHPGELSRSVERAKANPS